LDIDFLMPFLFPFLYLLLPEEGNEKSYLESIGLGKWTWGIGKKQFGNLICFTSCKKNSKHLKCIYSLAWFSLNFMLWYIGKLDFDEFSFPKLVSQLW
jgi:hypothetical protein